VSSVRSAACIVALFMCTSLAACSGGGSANSVGMPPLVSNKAPASGAQAVGAHLRKVMNASPEMARSSDAFVDSIGVNTHLFWGAYSSNFPAVKAALFNLGVRHIRDGMVWLSWGTGYYDQLNALGSAGIHSTLLTSLSFDPVKVANYVSLVPQSLEAIEGPNEPNLAGGNWAPPVQAFQQSLYAAVRANPLDAQVAVLSSALASNLSDYGVLGNLSSYLDYGNMHDYFGGNAPDAAWITGTQLPAAALVSGSKPVIATETGYCTSTASQGVTPTVMGKYVPRMFFEQFNAGVKRTLEYELLDDNTVPSDYWNQCGLMTYNFAPKPAYTALQNLIGLLSDTTTPAPLSGLSFTLLGNTAAVHHTLLQKNDGSFYLALWLKSSDYDQTNHVPLTVTPQTIAVSFGSAVSSLTDYSYDDLGNLTPSTVPVSQNVAQVSVTDKVQIFKVIPGNSIANIPPAVANPAAHWSFDDGSGTVAVDSVTPAGNASLTSNASWMNGIFGLALDLPSGAHATAAPGLIDTSQSYSVSAWLMLGDPTAIGNAVAVQGLQASSFTLGYIPNSGFAFTVYARDTTWQNTKIQAVSPGIIPAIGTWYPVVGVFDKPNCQILLYVNGTLQSKTSGCTAFAAAGPTEFGRGMLGTGYYPGPWSGAIDEVNIYQRALTPAEAASASTI
jgi:hypothetical protein